jgi:predicted RNA-binding Zn-ribbon protein involved in translation (DUF1610 family)
VSVRVGDELFSDDGVYSERVIDMYCTNCGEYIATVSSCDRASSYPWYCKKSACVFAGHTGLGEGE